MTDRERGREKDGRTKRWGTKGWRDDEGGTEGWRDEGVDIDRDIERGIGR